jgi:hypothetical protein
VLLGTGEPAQGIVAEFSRGNAKLFAETGADGRFVFDAVSAGTYVLRLEDPVGIGLARRAGTIAVSGPIDLGDITLDDAAPLVTTSRLVTRRVSADARSDHARRPWSRRRSMTAIVHRPRRP